MASSRAKSHGCGLQRSISPGGRFVSSSALSQSASSFCSTSAAFSSPPAGFFTRSASPTRLNLAGSSQAVRFSIEGSRSPSRSLSRLPVSSPRNGVVKKQNSLSSPAPRKTCMCSPTNHPGSFRCSLHKNAGAPSNRLDARRSSMTNSLVRIGTVEGEWVRRALAALIRPSSHQQRRGAAFQPRPSRLSIMSKAEE
ncbi:unnamed protein product [Victoria cruziana]